MKQTQNGLVYGVKLRGESNIIEVAALEAIDKWPGQIYAYLEERIEFKMPDTSKIMPCLKEVNASLADGKPILTIACSDLNGIKYLCEWPGCFLTRKLMPFNDDCAGPIIKYLQRKLQILDGQDHPPNQRGNLK